MGIEHHNAKKVFVGDFKDYEEAAQMLKRFGFIAKDNDYDDSWLEWKLGQYRTCTRIFHAASRYGGDTYTDHYGWDGTYLYSDIDGERLV